MFKRWLARLGLLVLTVVVCSLTAELLVRLVLPPPQLVSITAVSDYVRRLGEENRERIDTVAPRPQSAGLFVGTPTGRRMRANTRVHIEHSELSGLDVIVETNSLGYRNRELGEKTRRRVLFLGDSITAQDYLPEPLCWVRQVEVRSQASGEPLETINAGVGAIGLQNELAILMETGLSTQPDVVVLGFYLNDVHDSRGVQVVPVPTALRWSWVARHVCRAVSMLGLLTGGESEHGVPRSQWEQWYLATYRRYRPGPGDPKKDPPAFHQLLLGQFPDWGNAWSEGAWERMQPSFAELKRLSQVHGFQLLVIAFPVRPQVEAEFVYDQPQQKLRSVCAELSIPLLDLLPRFRAASSQPREALFFDQCHPTPAGNELIAEWVLEFLQAQQSRF